MDERRGGEDLAESVFTGGCWDCHAREWIYGIAGMNVILWLLTQAKGRSRSIEMHWVGSTKKGIRELGD